MASEGRWAGGVPFEDPATHYRIALQSQTPYGPYLLGGWSLGGLIAFEVARQLRAAGETIEELVLLDTVAPGARPNPYALPQDPASLQEQWHGAHSPYVTEEGHSDMGTLLEMYATHLSAAERYRPSPTDLPVLLLRAAERLPLGPEVPLPDNVQSATMGWDSYVQGTLSVRPVPGRHDTMVQGPHGEALAKAIRESLATGLAGSADSADS